jgi:hypothetical protein
MLFSIHFFLKKSIRTEINNILSLKIMPVQTRWKSFGIRQKRFNMSFLRDAKLEGFDYDNEFFYHFGVNRNPRTLIGITPDKSTFGHSRWQKPKFKYRA